MVNIQPVRLPDAESPEPADAAAGLRLLLENRGEEDRLVDMLAFALAVAGRQEITPDTIPVLRQRAEAELASHSLRYLHNRVEEIRQDAIRERLGQLRRPPGLAKLILANLLAFGLAAAALSWLAAQPETLGSLSGAIANGKAGLATLFQNAIAGIAGLIPG